MDTQEAQESLWTVQVNALYVRPYATWILVAVNVLVWVITQGLSTLGASSLGDALLRFFILPINPHILTVFGSFDPSLVHQGQYWRFLTANFLHVAGFHIDLNMMFLWSVGSDVEKYFGARRFVLIYFLSGIAGYLVSYVVFPHIVTVGASSALFGIMAAHTIFFSKHHRAARRSRVPALAAIWLVAVVNLGLGFVIPHVNYVVHVGAFVWGVLLSLVISPYYRNGEDTHRLSRTWFFILLLCIAEMVIAYLILR